MKLLRPLLSFAAVLAVLAACSVDDDDATATPSTVCTPGTTVCADGESTRTCNAIGDAYEAAVSCGGKTCAGNACTTCNVGDASCGSTPNGPPPPCTAGSFRCGTGRELQQCQADGTYRRFGDCDYFCSNGACAGECAPGASRCCIQYEDGTKGCGGPAQPVYEACIAGECADISPKPSGVVMETCGTNAMWGPGTNCSTNCTAGSDRVTVGCGYCAPSGAAMCLGASCTCE